MKSKNNKRILKQLIRQIQSLQDKAVTTYYLEIQNITNKRKRPLATGHMSDVWSTMHKNKWVNEFNYPNKPIFRDLANLQKIVDDIGLRPSNRMRFEPKN